MESYCVKYYEYKNKFFCREEYHCAKKENKQYMLFKRKNIKKVFYKIPSFLPNIN